MRNPFLILPALLASFAATAAGATPGSFVASEDARYPLMAWDYVDDEPTLKSMADCGITSVAFIPPRLLDLCEKYRVGAIVHDDRLSGPDFSKPFDAAPLLKNLPALVKEIGGHPAVLGYHIKDEPWENEYAELAKAVEAVKEQAPGKWPYINLRPGLGEKWDKYLEEFITTCKPTVLSYDRYSLVGDEGEIHSNFWSCLAQSRAIALKHNIPLWNIILTSPHWDYRDMTEADLRLQIWGSLVYGVRGLAYYKFCSKELAIHNAPDLGNFRGGPLDPFGERTPTWDWLRRCNREVQNLASVLLRLKSDDVYHTGWEVPSRNREIGPDNLVKSMPAGEFIIGDFTHEDGGRWVMIVNRSLKRSAKITPTFKTEPKALKYVSPVSGELKRFPAPYYYLAPGQGVLLKPE